MVKLGELSNNICAECGKTGSDVVIQKRIDAKNLLSIIQGLLGEITSMTITLKCQENITEETLRQFDWRIDKISGTSYNLAEMLGVDAFDLD